MDTSMLDADGSNFVDSDSCDVSSSRERPQVGDGEPSGSSNLLDEADDPLHPEHKRHSKYYMDDGDCIILVENTLFKIHRFLLARDSSAFADMFSMPAEDNGGEGRSDENPIVLPGEKAASFKTLLAVLYALPAVLKLYETEVKLLNRVLTVAEMANKYHFTSTTEWALNVARTVTGCGDDLLLETPTKVKWCSPYTLRHIIEVASLCGDDHFRDHAVLYWRRLIKARMSHPLYAIDVAERFGLSEFAGLCYYRLLHECDAKLELREPLGQMRLDRPTAPHVSTAVQGLTPTHKTRLLSGAFSLTALWEDVRCTTPTFLASNGCLHHAQTCAPSWEASWRYTTATVHSMQLRPFDAPARIAAMLNVLDVDAGVHMGLAPGCRTAALESVRALLSKVEGGLAGHFVDLTKVEQVVASE